MKAFLASVIFAVVLAAGAAFVLNDNFQTSVSSAFATEGARVDQHGTNLISY